MSATKGQEQIDRFGVLYREPRYNRPILDQF